MLVLVAAHVVSMVIGVIVAGWPGLLVFSPSDVLQRMKLWELFSYPFAQVPSLWFAVEMLFFYWFGREVEHYLGSRFFVVVYALLVLAPALVGVVLGLGGMQVVLAGSGLASMGIFVMFAFLYPTVELLFRIQARWFAVGLAALHALQAVSVREWGQLALIVSTLACAFECARRIGIRSACSLAARMVPQRKMARHSMPPRRPQPVPSGAAAAKSRRNGETHPGGQIAGREEEMDVDAILEKISRSGLSSLSGAERRRLESARRKLLEGKGADS